MAIDKREDSGSRLIDASHLFPVSEFGIGIRNDSYLRGFTYAIHLVVCAPLATRSRQGCPCACSVARDKASYQGCTDLMGVRGSTGSAQSSLGTHHTHYSAAELAHLIEAANRVCDAGSRKTPTLVILKKQAPAAVAASA
jgi:hypothetical protein